MLGDHRAYYYAEQYSQREYYEHSAVFKRYRAVLERRGNDSAHRPIRYEQYRQIHGDYKSVCEYGFAAAVNYSYERAERIAADVYHIGHIMYAHNHRSYIE